MSTNTPTPRTDAAFREMGRLAAGWKSGDLDATTYVEKTRKPYGEIQDLRAAIDAAKAREARR